MRKLTLSKIMAAIVTSSLAMAQAPAFAASILSTPAPASWLGGNSDPMVWNDLEYLLWWDKDAPLGTPLATTSNSTDAGILGRPSTRVLYGNSDYDYDSQNGFRLTSGLWLDNCRQYGLEASLFYFLPKNQNNYFIQTTDPAQILAIPFVNVTPGGGSGGIGSGVLGTAGNGNNSFIIAGIDGRTGSISVDSSIRFWGGEANGLYNFYRDNQFQTDLLLGFRYVDLHEDLSMHTVINIEPVQRGSLRNPGFNDVFDTRNQFYGGQLGVKGQWTNGWLFADALAKVALGTTDETLNIHGSFQDPEPAFLANYGTSNTTGLLTQRSNIGTTNRNRFAWIPEVRIQGGVNFLQHFRAFVGYDFMYISNVIRPGDQIDNNINLSQAGVSSSAGYPPNNLTGPARPARSYSESSFWAQGIDFGLTIDF